MTNTCFPYPVIYFDGVCHLCNSSVQWIIRQDKKNLFKFCPLQSKQGAEVLLLHLSSEELSSIVLHHKNEYFTEAAAVLKIASLLGGIWSFSKIFNLLPVSLLNRGYRFLAKNRYRWFGQKAHCMIPSPSIKEKFLTYTPLSL